MVPIYQNKYSTSQRTVHLEKAVIT
jgi:hypothetical protein